MANRRTFEEPESLEELVRRFVERVGKGRLLLIVLAVVIVIWLLSGIYIVRPGEQGVVRQFGKEIGKTSPGLHYHLPRPIQRVNKVNLAEIRTLYVGFQQVSPGRYMDVPSEALMLTADENIVDIHLIVQYRVTDASQYLFKVKNVEDALKAAGEISLRGIVGQNPIDYVMVEARADVEDRIMKFLQDLMDSYESGVLVTKVSLQEVDAPQQVRDAFHDVVRAREDRERLIREAEGYTADVVPKARGEKQKVILAAEAYKQQRIIRAQGDAAKFLKVLEEYQKAKDVTRRRLYLETMEAILPGIEKVIIDSQIGGNLLQFLPLKEITSPGR